MPAYPTPKGGVSLVLSFRLRNSAVLILGSGQLAATRAFAALEADSSVIILAKGGIQAACDELQWRVQQHQVEFVDWDALPGSSGSNDDIETLNAYLKISPKIALAVVTDTLTAGQRRDTLSAEKIYAIFKSHNILVNTTDIPESCDFSFTSVHRLEHHETGEKTMLQFGVTTNGHGCRLASRIRREIVSKLPREVGAAVDKVGQMRSMAVRPATSMECEPLATEKRDTELQNSHHIGEESQEELSEDNIILTPNRPVPSRSDSETALESRKRQIKWVAQVSEYWPISKLAAMSSLEMEQVLAGKNNVLSIDNTIAHLSQNPSLHYPGALQKPGRILLVGSGPGHPSLLTIATHSALTQLADLVLSDKLVPDAVLALIPKHVEVRIARKFPGNAEGAQMEMMEAAVGAAKRGLTVVRLKQGDPVVYGRAGEEVLYFRLHGFEPLVIPGVSSALAAPTFAGIPVTQRGVAESFIICTGVGRKGKDVKLPGYDRGRTLIVLMGVARIVQVIKTLVNVENTGGRDGPAYPTHLPIAIIERASMPDQRVIASTLKNVVSALESNGEQRPPGMMVIGWAVLALHGEGDVGVLDDAGDGGKENYDEDEARVKKWLGGGSDGSPGWRVREGLEKGWECI